MLVVVPKDYFTAGGKDVQETIKDLMHGELILLFGILPKSINTYIYTL